MRFKVLVIDDETANIKMLSSLLKETYKVYASKSGKQGVELAKLNQPDIILLDIVMPEQDGFQTIQQLKQDPLTEHIPVIFITGLNTQENEEQGLSLGACDYIYKPFYPPVVLARITTQIKIIKQNRKLVALSEKLRAASDAKGAFLANMSHEIRTPLTTIMGYSQGMIAGDIKAKEQPIALSTIYTSAKHLLSLINDILDFSKIEAGQLDVECIHFDLSNLLAELQAMAKELTKDKPVEFSVQFNNALPRFIYSDPTRLKQILLNLLSNAVKFTQQGQVSIICSVNGDFLNFDVKDTGIGIAQDKLAGLFQDFYQVDKSTTRRFGGTGLGLSISKSLANKLGGDITVSSEVGVGSQFTLSCLLKAGSDECFNHLASLDVIRSDHVLSPIKGRVLLAEDHEQNRQLFKLLMENVGLEVETVADGEQAVELAMTDDFDLILMDIHMPKMDGMEALNLMRQSGIDTQVIALTANVMAHDIKKYLAFGFIDHCAKPIDKYDFIEKVRKYIEVDTDLDLSQVESSQKMKELTAEFIDLLPRYATDLKVAANNHQFELLYKLAHQLHGSAASYGFDDVSSLAADLEQGLKKQACNNQIAPEQLLICQQLESLLLDVH
ncbi:response regulator [Catenovulum sp. SM1970]|uniref:response regulator n=1 Tax=Marinifaba aquimaris TaxID=2741323 RepID=UPI001572C1F8|nr:response regulator [Marinifaba aquimaris]NTS78726.1 response regulator [Marinifaba aquimaris]